MNDPGAEGTIEDKEEDAAAKAAIRKVKIAVALMALILLLGFGAVVAAIFVKLTSGKSEDKREASLTLPLSGCTLDLANQDEILSSGLDDDRLMLIVSREDKRYLILYHLGECRKTAEVKLGS